MDTKKSSKIIITSDKEIHNLFKTNNIINNITKKVAKKNLFSLDKNKKKIQSNVNTKLKKLENNKNAEDNNKSFSQKAILKEKHAVFSM